MTTACRRSKCLSLLGHCSCCCFCCCSKLVCGRVKSEKVKEGRVVIDEQRAFWRQIEEDIEEVADAQLETAGKTGEEQEREEREEKVGTVFLSDWIEGELCNRRARRAKPLTAGGRQGGGGGGREEEEEKDDDDEEEEEEEEEEEGPLRETWGESNEEERENSKNKNEQKDKMTRRMNE